LLSSRSQSLVAPTFCLHLEVKLVEAQMNELSGWRPSRRARRYGRACATKTPWWASSNRFASASCSCGIFASGRL